MKFYGLSDATFYDRIDTINQLITPFLHKKCIFFFEEYGAFKLIAFYYLHIYYIPSFI